MSQLAERYAVALFELAQEKNSVSQWQSQAKMIVKSLPEESHRFFQSCNISNDEKKEVLKTAFSATVDPMLMNFLSLLVDKSRFQYLKGIVGCFNHQCNEYRNVEEGILYSARPFTEKQIQEIESTLSKQRGKRCELENKVDERLLSGFKVMINNEIIDSSMKKNIESMKRELLKETR